MEKDLAHVEFVMYCVETYKASKRLNGKEAYQRLKETGTIRFIDDNFDSLHTFGDQEIVRNIEEYISNRIYTP